MHHEAEPGGCSELGVAQLGECRQGGKLAPARGAAGRDGVEFARLNVRKPGLDLRETQRHMPPQQALYLRCRAFEPDMRHIQPEPLVQLVAEEVRQRAGAERGVGHFARIRLDPGREFGQRLRRHARVGHQHHRRFAALDHAGEVGGFPAQIGIGAGVDLDLRLGGDPQRIAVGRRLGHPLRRDVAVRSGAVDHDHRLAQQARHRFGHRARIYVRRAARLAADDETDRLRRPGLGQRRRRGGAEYGEQQDDQRAQDIHVFPSRENGARLAPPQTKVKSGVQEIISTAQDI